MEVKIFNVGHGFCALLIADNSNLMLFDCGASEETGFRPSEYLSTIRCTGIERFIVTNYDEDHLRDLPSVRRELGCPIQILDRNPSITPEQLRQLKLRRGPLGGGMEALLGMLGTYTSQVLNPPVFPEVECRYFYNRFPDFEDTNNLSLVTFVHYHNIHIVFSGDIEAAGWRRLLLSPNFRTELARVNIFVAAHHGRASGYCEEVFQYCQPLVVIISDEAIQYETQETDYARHAAGLRWSTGETRRVLTTRSDGHLTIRQRPSDFTWQIIAGMSPTAPGQ